MWLTLESVARIALRLSEDSVEPYSGENVRSSGTGLVVGVWARGGPFGAHGDGGWAWDDNVAATGWVAVDGIWVVLVRIRPDLGRVAVGVAWSLLRAADPRTQIPDRVPAFALCDRGGVADEVWGLGVCEKAELGIAGGRVWFLCGRAGLVVVGHSK